jgi:hypothetical protein
VGNKELEICPYGDLEKLSKEPYVSVLLSRVAIHPALLFLGSLPATETFAGGARIYRSFVQPKVSVPAFVGPIIGYEVDSPSETSVNKG